MVVRLLVKCRIRRDQDRSKDGIDRHYPLICNNQVTFLHKEPVHHFHPNFHHSKYPIFPCNKLLLVNYRALYVVSQECQHCQYFKSDLHKTACRILVENGLLYMDGMYQ
ncbi:hypothetical protein BC832DRAFT_471939 [Gaertneriomyces semiglobifer]|nr:hypothetical protein BC832DRAFT_471939 [Gaertneriomyces semiglobifer]